MWPGTSGTASSRRSSCSAGAVIDFELPEHLGSLYNRFAFRYDGYASLLYVDRRGAPENRQFGFDLSAKIDLLARLVAGK